MRGQEVWSTNCAACHGEDLLGGAAPSLVGDDFFAQWTDRTVADLYERIQTTMPAVDPGSLTSDQYTDVVAFVLQANGFRPGEKELKSSAPELKTLVLRRPATTR